MTDRMAVYIERLHRAIEAETGCCVPCVLGDHGDCLAGSTDVCGCFDRDHDGEETTDPFEAVRNVPVVIWFCPHRRERGCKLVDWSTTPEGMTPRCVDCGQVGPLYPAVRSGTGSAD